VPHLYGGYVKIEVYLKPEQYDLLEKWRKKTGLKLSTFVRELLDIALHTIGRSELNDR